MSWCGEIRYAIIRKRDEWRSELVKVWPAAVISDSGFDGFLYAAVAGWV